MQTYSLVCNAEAFHVAAGRGRGKGGETLRRMKERRGCVCLSHPIHFGIFAEYTEKGGGCFLALAGFGD